MSKAKIFFERADFNKSPFGNERLLVVVKFPGVVFNGKPFKWIPSYKELDEIKKALDEIEKVSWKNEETKNIN